MSHAISNNAEPKGDYSFWSPQPYADGGSRAWVPIFIVIGIIVLVGTIPTSIVAALDMASLKAATKTIHIWTKGYAIYICPCDHVLVLYMLLLWPLWLPPWMMLTIYRHFIDHGYARKSDESLSDVSP